MSKRYQNSKFLLNCSRDLIKDFNLVSKSFSPVYTVELLLISATTFFKNAKNVKIQAFVLIFFRLLGFGIAEQKLLRQRNLSLRAP